MSNFPAWRPTQSKRLQREQQQPFRSQDVQSQPKGSKSNKSNRDDPPKSRAVRDLEVILDGLRVGPGGKRGKDPAGGCFCQAREHKLSSYTPICRSCGLVLCSLNLPHYLCPHCSSPLTTAAAISSNPSTSSSTADGSADPDLIARIESEIATQLAKEAREREQRIEEARRVAGDFPSLAPTPSPSRSGASTPRGGGANGGGTRPSSANSQHKVLSLNSQTKKVTVRNSPAPSKHSSTSDLHGTLNPHSSDLSHLNEPIVTRVSAPLSEEAYLARLEKKVEVGRPWLCLATGGVVYVREEGKRDGEGKGSRRNKKGKGKEKGDGEGATGGGEGKVASGSGT